jgi:hypothetical protein
MRMGHYRFLSSSWKRAILPYLQRVAIGLAGYELSVLRVKSMPGRCSRCKIQTLLTLLTVESHGPPGNYKETLMCTLLENKN